MTRQLGARLFDQNGEAAGVASDVQDRVVGRRRKPDDQHFAPTALARRQCKGDIIKSSPSRLAEGGSENACCSRLR